MQLVFLDSAYLLRQDRLSCQTGVCRGCLGNCFLKVLLCIRFARNLSRLANHKIHKMPYPADSIHAANELAGMVLEEGVALPAPHLGGQPSTSRRTISEVGCFTISVAFGYPKEENSLPTLHVIKPALTVSPMGCELEGEIKRKFSGWHFQVLGFQISQGLGVADRQPP
jgi:hypothetical protein